MSAMTMPPVGTVVITPDGQLGVVTAVDVDNVGQWQDVNLTVTTPEHDLEIEAEGLDCVVQLDIGQVRAFMQYVERLGGHRNYLTRGQR